MQRGILIILSGFSGSGKGTIVSKLMEEYDQYTVSVSATTRSPREGEQEGVHYFFKTTEDFEKMIRKGAFLEYACYVGNYYGTPEGPVEELLAQGRDVILEIEYQGAVQVRSKRSDVVSIFVTPPSIEELERRLAERGTESEDVIRARLERAVEESQHMDEYDYILINDDLDVCTRQLHELVCAQHAKAVLQKEFISQIQEELKDKMHRRNA